MTDSPSVAPALTKEEWEDETPSFDDGTGSTVFLGGGVGRPCVVQMFPGFEAAYTRRGSEYAHALAALCLHGQPFGFTQEDVGTLHIAHKCLMDYERSLGQGEAAPEPWGRLLELASRISALLPPSTGDAA